MCNSPRRDHDNPVSGIRTFRPGEVCPNGSGPSPRHLGTALRSLRSLHDSFLAGVRVETRDGTQGQSRLHYPLHHTLSSPVAFHCVHRNVPDTLLSTPDPPPRPPTARLKGLESSDPSILTRSSRSYALKVGLLLL